MDDSNISNFKTVVICLYREECHRDWLRMRKTPLFGCICPQNQMKRRCDRIFSLINENPCISKYIYGGFMIFVDFTREIRLDKKHECTSLVYYFVDRVKHIGASHAIHYYRFHTTLFDLVRDIFWLTTVFRVTISIWTKKKHSPRSAEKRISFISNM